MPALLNPDSLKESIQKKTAGLKRDLQRLRKVDPVGAKIYFATDQDFNAEIEQILIITEKGKSND